MNGLAVFFAKIKSLFKKEKDDNIKDADEVVRLKNKKLWKKTNEFLIKCLDNKVKQKDLQDRLGLFLVNEVHWLKRFFDNYQNFIIELDSRKKRITLGFRGLKDEQ